MKKLGFYLTIFLTVSGCQWLSAKPPQEWMDWIQKAESRYQEKFASPTITHHIYLENPNEVAFVNFEGAYPRLQKESCDKCVIKVFRELGLETYVNTKGMNEKTLLEPEKPTPFFNNDRYYLSVYPSLEESKVRVFIHDLQQKGLEQKRKRQYFRYSKDWTTQGDWRWLPQPEKVTIHRSDGSDKDMEKVAEIFGNFKGKDWRLSVFDFEGDQAYKQEDETMLLFRDQSNGKATYGAGRFLNVKFPRKMGEMKDAEKVLVDFNYSYNPPCAVSTGFHCPLPIDTLNLAVEAGEKYSKAP